VAEHGERDKKVREIREGVEGGRRWRGEGEGEVGERNEKASREGGERERGMSVMTYTRIAEVNRPL